MDKTLPRSIILRDLLTPGLDVVFCGTAVGNISAARGHFYAGKGNKFWQTLQTIRLTPGPMALRPQEDLRVFEFGVGLTDLVKRHSGNDNTLRAEMYDVRGFEDRIRAFEPRFVAFNGKQGAKIYLEYKTTRDISYGLHARTIGHTKIFILPSTSGSARKYWDEGVWREFARAILTGRK